MHVLSENIQAVLVFADKADFQRASLADRRCSRSSRRTGATGHGVRHARRPTRLSATDSEGRWAQTESAATWSVTRGAGHARGCQELICSKTKLSEARSSYQALRSNKGIGFKKTKTSFRSHVPPIVSYYAAARTAWYASHVCTTYHSHHVFCCCSTSCIYH